MTLKECFAAGVKGRKVLVDGIVYRRVVRAGYFFRENGSYGEFAEVAEENTGTLVTAKPSDITLFVGGSAELEGVEL